MEGIKIKLTKVLRQSLLVGGLAFAPAIANAQSVFTGLRGPTEIQVDNRTSSSIRESQDGTKTSALVNNFVLKYWNGAEKGLFAFASLPYRNIHSGAQESTGMGDVTLGIGPRLDIGIGKHKLGLLMYAGKVLPTGNKSVKPALGTGRHDYKTGVFGTLLSHSRKYQVDFSLEYLLTQGKLKSNEITSGAVMGGRITDGLRLVAGPLISYSAGGTANGDFTLGGRFNARYTPPRDLGKKMHFELWYDKVLETRGASQPISGTTTTLVGRFNF